MPPAPGTVRLFLDIRELETFSGEQFHASTYPGPEYLAGKRVLVVGGGASAVQFLGELAYRSELLWVTRRPPQWVSGSIDSLKAVEWVEERAVSGQLRLALSALLGCFYVLRSSMREKWESMRNAYPCLHILNRTAFAGQWGF